ncbi:endopeptidase La [Spiroplasma endosymbiont of Anurida maritima]|uniref:endopeptidase La n=1 Tax=Spiroplasma endosymbiont of Anurida maritima TaxID=2967972 RepID=UPI0036D26A66
MNLPVLVTRGSYIYPTFSQVLEIGRQMSIDAVRASIKDHEGKIILLSQKKPLEDEPKLEDIYKFGTLATVKITKEWEDGSITATFKSLDRFSAKTIEIFTNKADEKEFIKAIGKVVKSTSEKPTEFFAMIKQMMKRFKNSYDGLPESDLSAIDETKDPSEAVDIVFQYLQFIPVNKKQKALEELIVEKRLELLMTNFMDMDNNNKIDDRINLKIKNKVDDQQKEYYLREKLRAIKEELGEMDDSSNEMKKYKDRLAKEPFPKVIKERLTQEIDRYETLPQASSESNIIRTYIDWMFSIPWHEKTKENYNLKTARKVLDKHHFGLEKVKDRILEYLAVKSLTKSVKGQIICLVGPPGVGKTSLAKAIAEAVGRNFVKVALGGVKDESEIRGHRKTYIGALPGRIIQSMKKAKTVNPLFLLDEIDKMASDYRGDPASAMLEVLDPEQNAAFSDHYIEESYDLGDVMFIATANYYENIPEALIDRMEIINLSSYTEIEKLNIATGHLISKVLENNGLTKKQVTFKEEAVMEIIKYYTREAGARQLERDLNAICRKFIVKMLNKEMDSLVVDAKVVNDLLGKRRYEHTDKESSSQIGVVTGLAYTQYGGDILPIEVNTFAGKGNLILTGKLGEVMKESASIALDYIKANAKKFKIENEFFDNNDIHIHVPEGAVPKDGPSAGITITTALISAIAHKKVSNFVGMTGEITLRGNVLPIGGLKEKSISAHRSGLKTILIPQKNLKDLDEIPKEVQKDLKIIPVSQYNQVYDEIFTEAKK